MIFNNYCKYRIHDSGVFFNDNDESLLQDFNSMFEIL